MRFGSVCSGIEAASVAWEPLGWKAEFFSEIEPFPSAVLAHHYPTVPNYGDMNAFASWPDARLDVLVGGTPCQSFSVAGLRGGMADPRGNLALVYLALANRYRPRWIVWENVPGVLSSSGGRDFGAFLGGLGELGYGWAYRVLDAQYFGVPQRRRRVFVVGYLGDWRRAAAVLFEPASLRGDSPPRREARERVANALTERPDRGGGNSEGQRLVAGTMKANSGGGGLGTDFDCDGGLIAFGGNRCSGPIDVAAALQAHGGPNGRTDFGSETFVTHSLRADGFDASEDGTGRGTPLVPVPIDMRQASRGDKITNNRAHGSGGAPGHGVGEAGDPAFTVSERGQAIAFDTTQITHPENRCKPQPGDPCHPLAAGAHAPAIAGFYPTAGRDFPEFGEQSPTVKTGSGGDSGNPPGARIGSSVRRLTPTECERLQGFPDDYTLTPYRGKPAADGPRYKALGNSMAVPVVRWIGERIAREDAND